MPSYSMAGMFLKGDTRNPATRPMDGAQYIHVIEDNSGNKAGSWVDAQGRNAVEREANHKQMFQMENAGKSKYQDDKDFLVSYTQSNKKCDTLRAEATVNDVEITKDKGEIAGYVKTIQGSEYQMQSVLSDCGEPGWKKEQVALLKLEEVKFTDTKMMGAYLKFYGEAILFDQAVNSRRAKQTELDGKIANKKKLEGSIFRANIEQLAYVDDWKKRQDGDQSITVAVTQARLAPKRTLQRTSSILMAGEAKELAKTLVDFFVEKVGVTEANLDNSIESFWKIFDGDEGAHKLSLGQFTQMSDVITDAGQKLTRGDMTKIFQLLDTDNSGTLEKNEFVAEITAIFQETHGQQFKKQKAAATARASAFFGGAGQSPGASAACTDCPPLQDDC